MCCKQVHESSQRILNTDFTIELSAIRPLTSNYHMLLNHFSRTLLTRLAGSPELPRHFWHWDIFVALLSELRATTAQKLQKKDPLPLTIIGPAQRPRQPGCPSACRPPHEQHNQTFVNGGNYVCTWTLLPAAQSSSVPSSHR